MTPCPTLPHLAPGNPRNPGTQPCPLAPTLGGARARCRSDAHEDHYPPRAPGQGHHDGPGSPRREPSPTPQPRVCLSVAARTNDAREVSGSRCIGWSAAPSSDLAVVIAGQRPAGRGGGGQVAEVYRVKGRSE